MIDINIECIEKALLTEFWIKRAWYIDLLSYRSLSLFQSIIGIVSELYEWQGRDVLTPGRWRKFPEE